MNDPHARNVTWHRGELAPEERRKAFGHGAALVWLTGLSGSGKSTIASRVEKVLVDRGVFACVLDGDNVRHGLCSDLGFSREDRAENLRRIGEVAKLIEGAGAIVLAAFVSPYAEDRRRIRSLLPPREFVEVYVSAPLSLCERRDPKGLYAKARRGEIRGVTGIDDPYEPPLHPEVVVDSAALDVDASVQLVVSYLERSGIIEPVSTRITR